MLPWKSDRKVKLMGAHGVLMWCIQKCSQNGPWGHQSGSWRGLGRLGSVWALIGIQNLTKGSTGQAFKQREGGGRKRRGKWSGNCGPPKSGSPGYGRETCAGAGECVGACACVMFSCFCLCWFRGFFARRESKPTFISGSCVCKFLLVWLDVMWFG